MRLTLSIFGRLMDRLESMAMLVAVTEAGSLSAASRRLAIPLATVSRKVSDLEKHLGTRLLNRSARRLTLTESGRSYVAACRRILQDIDEADRVASGEYTEPKGELSITAPIVFGRLHVLPVVSEFLMTHPHIDVRLLLTDHVANLLEDAVDVAVRVGTLNDSSLVATRLGSIQLVVCGSPTYFANHGTPREPRDLGGHACVTFAGLTSPEHWVFARGKKPLSVPIHSRLVVSTAEAAVDAAIAGVGITRVLSYQSAAAIGAGALVRVLAAHEPAPTPVHLVHGSHSLVPLKLRAFLDHSAPRLKARLVKLR
jgi:DNA-binding transcriptional LysR family regulator